MPAGGNWKEMFNAACEGDIELLRYHVDCGVDVDDAHPEFLSTPLMACILARQQASAELLIESGANIHLQSEFDEGMTPLQAARHVVKLVDLESGLESEPLQAQDLPRTLAGQGPDGSMHARQTNKKCERAAFGVRLP